MREGSGEREKGRGREGRRKKRVNSEDEGRARPGTEFELNSGAGAAVFRTLRPVAIYLLFQWELILGPGPCLSLQVCGCAPVTL